MHCVLCHEDAEFGQPVFLNHGDGTVHAHFITVCISCSQTAEVSIGRLMSSVRNVRHLGHVNSLVAGCVISLSYGKGKAVEQAVLWSDYNVYLSWTTAGRVAHVIRKSASMRKLFGNPQHIEVRDWQGLEPGVGGVGGGYGLPLLADAIAALPIITSFVRGWVPRLASSWKPFIHNDFPEAVRDQIEDVIFPPHVS